MHLAILQKDILLDMAKNPTYVYTLKTPIYTRYFPNLIS